MKKIPDLKIDKFAPLINMAKFSKDHGQTGNQYQGILKLRYEDIMKDSIPVQETEMYKELYSLALQKTINLKKN